MDRSLEVTSGGCHSILTPELSEVGRETLEAILVKHSREWLLVGILKGMTFFLKVPFSQAHVVSGDKPKVRNYHGVACLL